MWREFMIFLLLFSVAIGVVALCFAFITSSKISNSDAGNDRMKEIASYIH